MSPSVPGISQDTSGTNSFSWPTKKWLCIAIAKSSFRRNLKLLCILKLLVKAWGLENEVCNHKKVHSLLAGNLLKNSFFFFFFFFWDFHGKGRINLLQPYMFLFLHESFHLIIPQIILDCEYHWRHCARKWYKKKTREISPVLNELRAWNREQISQWLLKSMGFRL